MKYDVISWEEEGTWSAHAPSVPGVYGVGKTAKAAEEDLCEALDVMFDYLDELGEKKPKARRVRLGYVEV